MSHTYAPRTTPAAAAAAAAATAPQHLLASFPTYAGAEQVVDRLSDSGFPVEHSRIVGNDLRTVEYVTGRITSNKAAVAGSASGAWFGLFFGLLLGLFSNGSAWFVVIVGSTLIGALWGGVFGYTAHRATQGRRDFGSVKGLEAERYDVYVDASRADAAIRASGLL